jgi:voltage-gated potassium channel
MASGRQREQHTEEARLQRWERATAYPLTALSVLFIAVYAWPIL